jgi:two-component system, OmpR family, sensor histidine kinase KdpD
LLLHPENSMEQQRELATIVNEEADRMTWLVTEAIQMARIEAGEIQLNRTPTSLPKLLSKALGHLRLLTEERAVDVHADPNVRMIEADTELLELAIRQVIDNALKYSPPTSAIHVRLSAGENGSIISIRDEGPGIPEADQAHVFDKFYRGTNTRSKLAGTGMGLAVARQILRSHGGDIQLATTSEKGSEFIVSLPVASEAKRR